MEKRNTFNRLTLFSLLMLLGFACLEDGSDKQKESDENEIICKQTVSGIVQEQVVTTKADQPKNHDCRGFDNVPPLVTAEPAVGTYPGPIYVSLDINEVGMIFYTLDGTQPNDDDDVFDPDHPIPINATSELLVVATDVQGNLSETFSFMYVLDIVLPVITVDAVSTTTVSTDPVDGETVSIQWQTDYDGTYRFEISSEGGREMLLFEGPIEADIEEKISYISGTEFSLGANTLYLYVTNEIGNTGYTTFNITGL